MSVTTNGREGGDLTLFMTGKKPRPSTEPMYSGGNRRDFPITSGYNTAKYTDFISRPYSKFSKYFDLSKYVSWNLWWMFFTFKKVQSKTQSDLEDSKKL
ncbi:hypothetical protein OS493_039028 [Desmophyllum pertusum]|uniref:Uncharacterized protein n=1 Tax=Desmophyllum pertusum TaxID=174260 RepID=A0A9X0CTR8_9CNID|nr:hypothetical protein OS493_039028 [Desmophyllum pertusum]